MCLFFKKLKPSEVYSCFQTYVPNTEIDGVPPRSERRADNYKVSEYSNCKKESCHYSLETERKGLRLDYGYYFDYKTQEMFASVWIMNLGIADSKRLQEAIIKAVPKLTFSFLAGATIIGKARRKCKKISEVRQYMEEWCRDFNEAGAIDFFSDLRKERMSKK